MIKSPLRYPGGKSKHTGKILQYFTRKDMEYYEPFVGGGSVFLASDFSEYSINDVHPEVFDFWRMVKECPYDLVNLIEEHTPILDHRGCKKKSKQAIDLWKRIKEDKNNKQFAPGYRFLFLNRTCYSGIVTGGPVGGMEQKSNYPIICRWSSKRTISAILQAHEKLQNCRITNLKWQDIVKEANSSSAMYLDPPYLEKGFQCYEYAFTLKDHEEFADTMKKCPGYWIVTVDNCSGIKELWRESDQYVITEEEWHYSMVDKRRKNKLGKELFIVSRECYDSK